MVDAGDLEDAEETIEALVEDELLLEAPVPAVPEVVDVPVVDVLEEAAEDGLAAAVLNVKPVLVTVPPGATTLTLPLAPLATKAVIWVSESTVKLWAAVPPNLTSVAPVKLEPVITTESPVPAEVGVKLEIVGFRATAAVAVKVKSDVEFTEPPVVVTFTLPVAPLPTKATICVAELDVIVADIPPNVTLALLRLVPVIVTAAP